MTKQNDSAPDVAGLKLHGVGRDEASERTLIFYFNRVPTDHELKAIHERNNAPDADALEFVKNAICLADFDFDREKIGDEQWAETIALAALTAPRAALKDTTQ